LIRKGGIVGFYATRWVEAANSDEAELKALEILRNDPALEIKSEKLRKQEPAAKVYFEEIQEMSDHAERTPNKGATWFDEN
jgi:DNA-binding GntR family transcriptional regulator